MNELGGMYGREGAYFGHLPDGFQNYVWIELIGFDNTRPDFGVEELIATMGFRPEAMLLLVASVDFIHAHRGMEKETELDPFVCSYNGHSHNDCRARQRWTNYQLRALTRVLREHGIESYISVFDLVSEHSAFAAEHPELLAQFTQSRKRQTGSFLYMTKRIADGSYYEDEFLRATLAVLRDYSFDGIHLADGVCRPRLPVQSLEHSDDMFEQAGIPVPAEDVDREAYLLEGYRRSWLEFCERRWAAYLEKTVKGIHESGFKVIVNSTWTKDPLEALYRYGIDYARMAELPIHAMVVENGSPTLAILDDGANAGYHMTPEDRKAVHYMLRASLLHIAAAVGERIPLRPLFPVRDTMEQYDVIHHLPTSLQRHAAALFVARAHRADGSLRPVATGNTYCLGDGLRFDDWRFLRLCSDNAYAGKAAYPVGATAVYSDARNREELYALMDRRSPHSTRWIAALMERGAMIGKVAHVRDLDAVCGTLVVPNPERMPKEELARIRAYDRGEVVYLHAVESDKDHGREPNPVGMGFPYPLLMEELPEDVLQDAVTRINGGLATVSPDAPECRVQEMVTGPHTARYVIENQAYYYTRPTVSTHRSIEHATDITKGQGYRVTVKGDFFSTLVPLCGVAVVEVEFKEE